LARNGLRNRVDDVALQTVRTFACQQFVQQHAQRIESLAGVTGSLRSCSGLA
jgi:hypothetical protein